MVKRSFDFSFALFCLFLSLPILCIVILLIWIQDAGPILYRQKRVGRDGKIFDSMQFRSMIPDADIRFGPLQLIDNDPRVTRIGKLLRVVAMDELPQLWNIVKGDMSFVGPRALRPVEIDGSSNEPRSIWEFNGAKERSKVRPGLTGVAQVLLPRDTPRELKFQYDIWYINNQDFMLDIYLIFISFLITFCCKWEIRKDKIGVLTNKLRNQVVASFD